MASVDEIVLEDALVKAQQLKEQGNDAFRQKQFGTALTYYSLALELDPSNATLHLNRAICHGSLNQWVHSKIDAEQAMEIAGEYYAKAHCRLILAVIELKEYKQARTELQIAKMHDDSADVQRLEKLLLKRANLTLAPNASDFDVVEDLGEGNFSKVFKAKHKYTNRVYAIKTIEKQQVQQLRRRHKNIDNEIMMEKAVLAKLNHPNIIKLFGTFHDVGSLYYLMEFCDGGELWSFLKLKDGSMAGLPPTLASYYIAEILNALEYMHRQGIVHRDLKPENLMLSSSGHVKLIDFGTAKDMIDPKLNGQEFVGTAEYMSPETIDTRYAGPEADLWALGCIAFQFYAGRSPFAAGSPYLSFLKIRRGHVSFPEIIPEAARELIERLLTKDTAQRFLNATGVVRPSMFDVIGTKLGSNDKDEDSDEEVKSDDDEKEERKSDNSAKRNDSAKQDSPRFSLEDMSVYQYTALRELPFFKDVKARVEEMLLLSTSDDVPVEELSLCDLHKYSAICIPTLKELAVNATAFACSEVAELSRQSDADGVDLPAWAASFDVKRIGLDSPLMTMIRHNLRSRNVLHEPRVYRQFFSKQIEARAMRADISSREYIGLEHKQNHQWKEPFFFVQIADPQLGITAAFEEGDGQGGSTWEVEKENLRKAVSAINKLRPKFVVVSGDLTHASPPKPYYDAQVREVRRLLARVSETIPVLYNCGNHDVCDYPTLETLGGYLKHFGADYYGFWCGGLRGLVLNTCLWWHTPAELAQQAQEQMEWFEQEIEQAKLCAQHVAVFTHHPLFLHDGEEEEDPAWTIPIEVRRKLLRLMHHRKVQVVFSGHYHRNGGGMAYPNRGKPTADEAERRSDASDASSLPSMDGVNEDADFQGPESVITNSLGYPLDDTPPGFRIVEVHENEVKHYYVGLDTVPSQVKLEAD